MNVFLQDARWEEPAKTEACFAGFNNDGFCHKNHPLAKIVDLFLM